jgi:hypothetical protein
MRISIKEKRKAEKIQDWLFRILSEAWRVTSGTVITFQHTVFSVKTEPIFLVIPDVPYRVSIFRRREG